MRPRWPWLVLLLMGGIAAGVAWFWVDHRQVCARWASMQLSDAEAMQQLRLKPGRYNAYFTVLGYCRYYRVSSSQQQYSQGGQPRADQPEADDHLLL